MSRRDPFSETVQETGGWAKMAREFSTEGIRLGAKLLDKRAQKLRGPIVTGPQIFTDEKTGMKFIQFDKTDPNFLDVAEASSGFGYYGEEHPLTPDQKAAAQRLNRFCRTVFLTSDPTLVPGITIVYNDLLTDLHIRSTTRETALPPEVQDIVKSPFLQALSVSEAAEKLERAKERVKVRG